MNPCGFKSLDFHSFIVALENSCSKIKSKINITFTGVPEISKYFISILQKRHFWLILVRFQKRLRGRTVNVSDADENSLSASITSRGPSMVAGAESYWAADTGSWDRTLALPYWHQITTERDGKKIKIFCQIVTKFHDLTKFFRMLGLVSTPFQSGWWNLWR